MKPWHCLGTNRRMDFEILEVSQPTGDRRQRRGRFRKYRQQVFAGDGPVGRVDMSPPALYRLLHIVTAFVIFDQAVDKSINLAFYCLIRN